MKSKRGFGLMEVMVAAVVLAFLIIGLGILQKGNREGILRIRARDAANFVAQNVLDSLGSIGVNSLVKISSNSNLVFEKPNYTYYFEGKPQLDKNKPATKIKLDFDIKVALLDSNYSEETTYYNQTVNSYSKSLEATVSWQHKNSKQSIKVARVVR